MYYLYVELLDVSNSIVQGSRGEREHSLLPELCRRYTRRLQKHEQCVLISSVYCYVIAYYCANAHEGDV